MIRVVHLVPHDGIGGVESAARTLSEINEKKMKFSLEYMFKPKSVVGKNIHLYSPLPFVVATLKIIGIRPNFLIVSLWRSCVVALIVKILRPKTKIILFLHMSSHAHFLDKWLTLIVARVSFEIWADSKRSLDQRVDGFESKKKAIISFLINKNDAVTGLIPQPKFIFWGRLHPRKRLDRTIALIDEMASVGLNPKLLIIGPDEGALADVNREIRKKCVETNVEVFPAKNFLEIKAIAKGYSFFVQLSDDEGMAMSVVEAMQLGLVPVVSPVGEISNYCTHLKNSIIINADPSKEDAHLLHGVICGASAQFLNLRSAAIQTWQDIPTYNISMRNALCALTDEALG